MVDKNSIRGALLNELQRELDLLVRAANLARDEAISEESRAESKWDTRGQEAAYLAEGQARMARELQEALTLWRNLPLDSSDIIGPGAVFVIPQADSELCGIVGPKGGGTEFTCEGRNYIVVTPISPLGKSVMGKRAGDSIELPRGRKQVPHRIAEVF